MKYRIPNSKHWKNKWRVQELAKDFILEDTWELPILFEESKSVTFYHFQKNVIEPIIKDVTDNSLTGLLFRIRRIFGNLTGIDKNLNKLPIPGSTEKSIMERMSEDDNLKNRKDLAMDLSTDNYMSFRSVYFFENESLHELSNNTEHSLMHCALVPLNEKYFKFQMAVYVKHRNLFGRFYMFIIRPFRRLIVYPHIFNKSIPYWNNYREIHS